MEGLAVFSVRFQARWKLSAGPDLSPRPLSLPSLVLSCPWWRITLSFQGPRLVITFFLCLRPRFPTCPWGVVCPLAKLLSVQDGAGRELGVGVGFLFKLLAEFVGRALRGPPGRFHTSLTSVCCWSRWSVWLDGEPCGVSLCLPCVSYGASCAVHAGQMTGTPGDAHGCEAGESQPGCLLLSFWRWSLEAPGSWGLPTGPSGPGRQADTKPQPRQLLRPRVNREVPQLCPQRGPLPLPPVSHRLRDPQPASEHGPREGRGSLKSFNLSL